MIDGSCRLLSSPKIGDNFGGPPPKPSPVDDIYFILSQNEKICYNGNTIPGSSMVEQEAVNFEVAGSSPVPGATHLTMRPKSWTSFFESSPVPGATSKALRAFFVHQKVDSDFGLRPQCESSPSSYLMVKPSLIYSAAVSGFSLRVTMNVNTPIPSKNGAIFTMSFAV